MIDIKNNIFSKFVSADFFNQIKNFFKNPLSFFSEKKESVSVSSLILIKISPKVINQILMGILAVLILLIINIFFNKTYDVFSVVASVSSSVVHETSQNVIEPFKALSFYQKAIQSRNIFSPYMLAKKEPVIIKAPPPPVKPKAPEKPSISEVARGLFLVGISWGKKPKALIKNDQDHETYFVRPGQRIGTSKIRVKKIEKNKVIVTYDGEDMEL